MLLQPHPHVDALEEYCLGTLAPAAVGALEEHLLVCPSCQRRLRETERYVSTMRAAAAQIAAERRAGWWRPQSWVQRPAVLAAAGLASVVVLWVIAPVLRDGSSSPPVSVALAVMRGGGGLRAHAPARRPLLLTLDLKGVRPRGSYRVEMVDEHGRPVLQGSAAPSGATLVISAAARLAPGAYWVRIYDPSSPERPLREYGLKLE